MLTHGTVDLISSTTDLSNRLPDFGRILGEHLKAVEVVLERAYSGLVVPDGVRALFISIAPGGRQRLWIVRPEGQATEIESKALARESAAMAVPASARGAILLACAYFCGPSRVDVQSFGFREGIPMPTRLNDVAAALGREGVAPPLNDVLDAFWVAESRPTASAT
jgi:hypothetical protein